MSAPRLSLQILRGLLVSLQDDRRSLAALGDELAQPATLKDPHQIRRTAANPRPAARERHLLALQCDFVTSEPFDRELRRLGRLRWMKPQAGELLLALLFRIESRRHLENVTPVRRGREDDGV